MVGDIKTYLIDYLEKARACTLELKAKTRDGDILRAVVQKEIPREGELACLGGGQYFIHGIGCSIETSTVELNFDLSPDGDVSGFDPWKLWQFIRSSSNPGCELRNKDVFDQAIAALVREAWLTAREHDGRPGLLYPSGS